MPMILKHLELNGFKSFVDPTRLDFTQGFTAVVGPNGCGKSNISDAIRWVIGEQSSKSLRGTRITDLIFNGSGARKPVNRTEITITLGNVPDGLRVASVPNLSEEIKVTRCYHRSGESEFYINQIPCRLKDITDMFLDVGISPKVLTIIEQGHVADMVTSKPEDRRIWIEEAAGVLKFKVRKMEAIRKLESAGQNLDRVSDIVHELGRQVESLKRQAAKAERYKTFQSEIKELSISLFSRKIRAYQVELEEIEEALSGKNEQKTGWSTRIATLETQIAQLKVEIDELTTSLNSKREKLHELSGEISQNEHNIELKNNQIQQADQDIASARDEIARMNEEIETHAGEIETQGRDQESIAAEISSQEEACGTRVREWEHSRGLMRELEEKAKTCESQVMGLYNRVSQKKNDLATLQARREFLQGRDEKLVGEQNETQEQLQSAETGVQEAADLFEQKDRAFQTCQEERNTLDEELKALREKLRHQEGEVHSAKEIFMSQSSLLNSLKELRGKFEGFGAGVKALMSQAQDARPAGLREVLVDVIKAPAEFEPAIEAVMGERLQSMIVGSYSDTKEAIQFLREHKSGRGSFIPMQPKAVALAPLYMNGNQGVIGKLADLVETPSEYRSIFQDLLGNVVLVRDLETAFHLHGLEQFQGTVVTLSGEVIDAQGMVTGGLNPEDGSGLLVQNREIDTLTNNVQALQDELSYVNGEKERLTGEMESLETRFKASGEAKHQTEIERAQCHKDLEQLQKEQERLKQKLSTLDYERSSGAHEKEELSREFETQDYELKAAETEKEELEGIQEHLRSMLDSQREELEQRSEEINDLKVQISTIKGRKENIELELRRLDLQQENLRQRIEKREGDCKSNLEKIEASRTAIAEYEEQIVRQSQESQTLKQSVTGEEEALHEKEEQEEQGDGELRGLSRQLQELTEEISQSELKRSEINIQTTHIEERIWEDFNVSRDEMLNHSEEEIDEEAVAENLSMLKEKVAKLGEVNLAALSDYQVSNERYLFLKKQQDDLAESIRVLHQAIERIDKTTRQLFLDTFHTVNEHFKTIFARLFQGGKAELKLVDPDDPLESGVEISASPVGKTMTNLTLLSGGEKSMTALAMIFAILKVRPSPFVLLDEVDAALDEANVVRFQEMLKEMSGNTQFIIITHNQKSMAFADTLYGVTMEERGVSKVVSVNLN